jgi:hypothetical protein
MVAGIAFALLAFGGKAIGADIPEGLNFHYQYRSCEVTTQDPIYNLMRSSKCSIKSTTRFSDNSCNVQFYNYCRVAANGIESWGDVTTNEGVYPDRQQLGLSSTDGCLADGEDFVARANAGSVPGVRKPDAGYKYVLDRIHWDSEDLVAPTGNRIRAWHTCTYYYKIYAATYNYAQNSACGIAKRELCKVSYEYNECRNSFHGIESYKKINKRDESCGLRSEIGFFDLSNENEVISQINGRLSGLDVDKTISLLCKEEPDPSKRFYCLKINEHSVSLGTPSPIISELTKELRIASSKALAESIVGQDGKKSYDKIFDLYLADKSIKQEGDKASDIFFKSIHRSVKRMPDDIYFQLAYQLSKQSLLGSSQSSSQGNKNYDFNPLWSVITNETLQGRRPQFKDLGNLRVLLLSSDPGTSQKLRGQKIIVAEYFSRLISAYINKRSYDVLQLDSLKTKIKAEQTELTDAIKAASDKVKGMKLPSAMEQSALNHLSAVDTTQNMIPIINDLIKTAKTEIAQTIKDSDEFLQEITKKDKLFGVTLGQMQLIKGDYNHAVLALQTSTVNYQQTTDSEKSSSMCDKSFGLFVKNFKRQIYGTLASAKKIFDSLNSEPTISIDMLSMPEDQLNVSYAIMDILEKLDVAMGSDLAEGRMQILNQINSNVIEPLQSASEQLE